MEPGPPALPRAPRSGAGAPDEAETLPGGAASATVSGQAFGEFGVTSSLQFARGPQAVQVSAAPQATIIGPPPSAGPTAFGQEMRIPFSAFPESARVKLQEFDENNDESIDVHEIIAGCEALRREKQQTKRLMMLVGALLVLILLLFVGIAGITWEVTKALKDTKMNGAVMTDKASGDPIQTASADMAISADGMLSSRPSPDGSRRRRSGPTETDLPGLGRRSAKRRNGCRDDGSCPLTMMSQAVSTAHPLSSLLADAYFEELKTLKIVQGTSWIQFQVLAVARYAQVSSRHGSVVVLYTQVGELTLDGEGIFFEESIQGAFKRAGLKVDANGRRLVGAAQVIGLFNMLESAFEGAGLEDDAMPRMPGDQFELQWRKLTFCDDGPDGGQCKVRNYTGELRPVNWISNSSMTGDRPALVSHQRVYSQTFDGYPVTMSIESSEQWPGHTMYQVSNSTHTVSYQQYNGQRFYCEVAPSTVLENLVKGAAVMSENGRRLGERRDGVLVESLGFDTIDDVYCRKFRILQEVEIVAGQPGGGSGKTDIEILVWEDFGARRLHRIEMMDTAWVVDVLRPINFEDENPLPLEAFDIQLVLETCDDPSVFPPKKIDPRMMTDAVVQNPMWGEVIDSAGTRRSHALDHRPAFAPGMEVGPDGKFLDQKAAAKAIRGLFESHVMRYNNSISRRQQQSGGGAAVGGGCDNSCCEISTSALGPAMEEAIEKAMGVKFSIKFCFADASSIGGQTIPNSAGLTQISIAKVVSAAEASCPEVTGEVNFRADLLAPDNDGNGVPDGFNMNALKDTDFLLEGCMDWSFPIDQCAAAVLLSEAAGKAIATAKDGAEKYGVALDLGALYLKSCVYLKTWGSESPQCANVHASKQAKHMPLNPGVYGEGGYRMENTITVPKFIKRCEEFTFKELEHYWGQCSCCFGKKWGCWQSRWVNKKRQVCVFDPAGTESKAVAVIKIGVKLDIPFEIFCRSDRTAGQDGFGVGTSITAFAEIRSDILPILSYRADVQWLPMGSDEACQDSSIPYYSPKGNNQWFGPNAEWQWRDAYNFECAGNTCGSNLDNLDNTAFKYQGTQSAFSFAWFDTQLGMCIG